MNAFVNLAIEYIKRVPLFGVVYGHTSSSSTKAVDAICRWVMRITVVIMHL